MLKIVLDPGVAFLTEYNCVGFAIRFLVGRNNHIRLVLNVK